MMWSILKEFSSGVHEQLSRPYGILGLDPGESMVPRIFHRWRGARGAIRLGAPGKTSTAGIFCLQSRGTLWYKDILAKSVEGLGLGTLSTMTWRTRDNHRGYDSRTQKRDPEARLNQTQ